MALFLKVSNSLESLAAGLSEDLAVPRGSVFEPNYIVTQTEGMNNWLKLQLAARLGISANQRFLKPNDFIQQLYFLLNGPFAETLSRETLNWLLFQLLAEKDFIKKFPDITGYYLHGSATLDVRRVALAEKVADLFDQYQIYRPEMIQEWNRTSPGAVPAGAWQQYLWVMAKKKAGDALPDKSNIAAYILETLNDKKRRESLIRRLPAVHLFGLSIVTAYHIRLLFELSAYVDVYFHILNPAPSLYWLEDRSEKQLAIWKRKKRDITGLGVGNALLTGWGHVIRDTLSMFFRHDEFLNAYEEVGIVPPKPDSLLHKIQLDIFSAAVSNRQSLAAKDIRDGSLAIHSCYTIAREVEVLYNYLVHLVDKRKETLSPRDIVVMVSNIDTYAPYIKAVFGNAPYRFRYTIADESYSDGDNLFTALHSILLIKDEHFTSEEVLQLLDSSFIRKRFGISDLDRIREVVDAASIRFGMEGSREDDTYLVSWTYGLRRIMYGLCMSGGERYGEGENAFYPVDIVEGGESLSIIRFCHFVNVLMDFIRQRDTHRSIADWVLYTESLVHNLIFEPGEEPDEHYELLIRQCASLNLAAQYMPDAIAFEVFSRGLLEGLDTTSRAGLFAEGGITFCSLIPMRSIPFKVVAMMGLNYDKFPRREVSSSFNLMEQQPQTGDRNVKENDKHLFLETLLSAKEYLYLSYLGQNPNDNSTIPPSALVDELIDYIEAGADNPDEVRGVLVTSQPLQGFSMKYVSGDPRYYSYLDNGLAAVPPRVLPDKTVEALTFEEVQLEDLVRFFKNPFKTYYNKVLGIYYDEDVTLLPETELFNLNSLQKWSLKQQLLPVADSSGLTERLVRTGRLPLKSMATVTLKEIELQVEPVRAVYNEYVGMAEQQSVPLELRLGETLVTGALYPVFNGRLMQVCWSKNAMKYLTEAYIRYLAGASAGVLSGMTFLAGAGEPQLSEAVPLSANEARRRLTELLSIYKDGFKTMAPWYSSFKIKPEELEELTKEDFLKMVDQSLNSSIFPCTDPYIMPQYWNGYFGGDGVMEAFKEIGLRIVVPLPQLLPDYFA